MLKWWKTIETYIQRAGKSPTRILLAGQAEDTNSSLGKSLKRVQVQELAERANSGPRGLPLVLTAADIYIEGFCLSCSYREADTRGKSVYAVVGDSSTQCPGRPMCLAIPPTIVRTTDSTIESYQWRCGGGWHGYKYCSYFSWYRNESVWERVFYGSTDVAIEAVSACTGLFGKGASNGYTGELPKDSVTGASYNAIGVNGRKYLLPALFNLDTSTCLTLV